MNLTSGRYREKNEKVHSQTDILCIIEYNVPIINIFLQSYWWYFEESDTKAGYRVIIAYFPLMPVLRGVFLNDLSRGLYAYGFVGY